MYKNQQNQQMFKHIPQQSFSANQMLNTNQQQMMNPNQQNINPRDNTRSDEMNYLYEHG